MHFELKTFAKINLSLIVYSSRKDNYHPICSIFQNISLFDSMKIRLLPERKLILSCSNDLLPIDDKNIIRRIYNDLYERIPFGLNINIEKNIPIGSGMGGGSANAAGFISFLNNAANWNLDISSLSKLGKRFGADIPFFFYGGTALVRGIGEKLKPIPASKHKYFTLINPKISASTKEVYDIFDKNDIIKRLPSKTPKLLLNKQLGHNSLKEIVFEMIPELKILENTLIDLGAPTLYMSGSGSTTFLSFKRYKDAIFWRDKIANIYPQYFTKAVKATSSSIVLTKSEELATN
jgi:4-diphosphocytidyl-2-C-methyl-D-erythritol kinase